MLSRRFRVSVPSVFVNSLRALGLGYRRFRELLTCLGLDWDRVLGNSVMATTIKMWTMEDDFGIPTFYSKVKVSQDQTYASLWLRLEEKSVLEWPFDFWDNGECRRVPQKMESFSDMPADVFVLPLGIAVLGEASKRRRLDDAGTRSEATPEDGNCTLVREEGAVPNLDAVANSRVSGTSGITDSLEHQLHSTLISKDIWDRYLQHSEKIKRELQCSSLEDNRWLLRTDDINGHGVVKFFWECLFPTTTHLLFR